MAPTEYSSPVSIFDDLGRLCNFGWGRGPFFHYDSALLWTPRRLISEYERYIIFCPTHLFVFELCDDGLSGHAYVCAVSFLDRVLSRKFSRLPLSLGSLKLPNRSEGTAIRRKPDDNIIEFVCVGDKGRVIKVDVPHIRRNIRLRGEAVLTAPAGTESLAVNSPWRHEKERFRLSRCAPCWRVEGVMQFENAPIVFSAGRSWGIYEWGRGARPKKDSRYRAAACGIVRGRQIAFRLGYGTDDSTEGTENAFFADGVLHKLGDVTFKIPPADRLAPWTFTSSDRRLSMRFLPAASDTYRNNFLSYSLRAMEYFGFFSGAVTLDDGITLRFSNLTGIAEWLRSRG